MRRVFEIPPVPTVARIDGRTVKGTAGFTATVYEPDERAPLVGGRRLPLVSEWRASLAPGEPLRISPPKDHVGPTTAVIPRALLDPLPDQATLWVEWKFFVGAGQ